MYIAKDSRCSPRVTANLYSRLADVASSVTRAEMHVAAVVIWPRNQTIQRKIPFATFYLRFVSQFLFVHVKNA